MPALRVCVCVCARVCVCVSLSHVQLGATPWTAALQAPLSMGFSRKEYWSGLPCLPLGDLPNPGIEPSSLMSPELAGEFFTTCTTTCPLSGVTTRTSVKTISLFSFVDLQFIYSQTVGFSFANSLDTVCSFCAFI